MQVKEQLANVLSKHHEITAKIILINFLQLAVSIMMAS